MCLAQTQTEGCRVGEAAVFAESLIGAVTVSCAACFGVESLQPIRGSVDLAWAVQSNCSTAPCRHQGEGFWVQGEEGAAREEGVRGNGREGGSGVERGTDWSSDSVEGVDGFRVSVGLWVD